MIMAACPARDRCNFHFSICHRLPGCFVLLTIAVTLLLCSPRLVSAATPDATPTLGAIKPAPLKQDSQTLKLNSKVYDLVAGGSGRFLILWLKDELKLAIFDVNKADIVHQFAVSSDKTLFAAGQDYLLVLLPERRKLERYSLIDFQRTDVVDLKGDETREERCRGRNLWRNRCGRQRTG
jgi:hypothetical protein